MPITEGPDIVSLAPHKIYHLEYNTSVLSTTNEYISHINRYFLWLHDDSCQSKFVCTSLNGELWGRYGIKVQNADEEVFRITKNGAVLENILDFNEWLEVTIWYLPNTQIDSISCFLWCDNAPHYIPDNEAEAELLEALVSSQQSHNNK